MKGKMLTFAANFPYSSAGRQPNAKEDLKKVLCGYAAIQE
jgi:hypothetical protein